MAGLVDADLESKLVWQKGPAPLRLKQALPVRWIILLDYSASHQGNTLSFISPASLILALVLLLMMSWPVTALGRDAEPQPVAIRGEFDEILLGPHAEVLRDPTDKLTIDQVSAPPWSATFKPNNAETFSYGLDSAAYWFRFRLANNSGTSEFPLMYLVVTRVLVPEVDVYLPLSGGGTARYKHLKAGTEHIGSSEDLGHRIRAVALPEDIKSDAYIYVRIRSKVVSYSLTLFSKQAFDGYTRFEYLFFGLTAGIMVAMLLYNLAVALFLRDRAYGAYCAYLMAMIPYQALLTGWPLGVGINPRYLSDYVLTFFALSFFFATIFAREFLGTKGRYPVIDGFFKGIMALSLVNLIISSAGFFDAANAMAYVMGFAVPIFFLISAAIVWLGGYTPARYYLAGWLVLMGFTMVYAASGLGLVPHSFIINNMVCIGAAAESLMLALALADRIKLLQTERSRLKEKERTLTVLSITDELTGLYNKRWFHDKLPSEMNQARGLGLSLSMLVCDVDHFKNFNDTYGHAAGDLVLAGLGNLFRDALRNNDIAFRYGGEEFAVILPGVDAGQAQNVAERLRTSFAELKIALPDGGQAGATISIGVTQQRPGDSREDIFGRADAALYKAKKQGRNRVVVFS